MGVTRLRFDHHQRGFEETMNEQFGIKLSSAGLIYKHFGMEVLKNVLQENDENVLDLLYWKIYTGLIQEVDAIDNGVTQFEGNGKYKISTNLSSRVGRLNPSWNEPSTDELRMEQFEKAITMTGEEFIAIAKGYHKVCRINTLGVSIIC